MMRFAHLAAAGVLLAGCATNAETATPPTPTLAPPTPAGMAEVVPGSQAADAAPREDCDRTASLRPFPTRAQADAAVATK